MAAEPRIAGDAAEPFDDVVASHLPQAVEQFTRVIEHHTGVAAGVDQLRHDAAYPRVALGKDRRVVVIAHVLVLHHIVEVADNFRSGQVVAADGDQRLLHVQRDREDGLQSVERQVGIVEKGRLARLRNLIELRLGTAEVRQASDDIGHGGDGLGVHWFGVFSRVPSSGRPSRRPARGRVQSGDSSTRETGRPSARRPLTAVDRSVLDSNRRAGRGSG